MKIYKYTLVVEDLQLLKIPRASRFLSLQVQQGKPCVWFLVDEQERETYTLRIHTFGTGHDIDPADCCNFLGTYQLLNGNLVYHVWVGQDYENY